MLVNICSMNERMKNNDDLLNSEQTLKCLKEIEQNPKITQRGLAEKMGVSLGKINFLLNSLMEKGVIEARNFTNSKHKFAYMYLLTPRGIKTKFQLIHNFFIWKTQEYAKLKREIASLKKEASLLSLSIGNDDAIKPGKASSL